MEAGMSTANALAGMNAARAAKARENSDEESSELLPKEESERDSWGCGWAAICGPAMVASLADTDVGCLLVALESGAQYGYLLLPLQVILVPVLLLAQELTVRLGVYTRQGLTALIREKYGNGVAYAVVGGLLIYCIAITVSELSGVAGVAQLWGVGWWSSLFCAAAVLLLCGLGLAYRSLEKFAIFLGMFEAIFIVTMMLEPHDPEVVVKDLSTILQGDSRWLFLRLMVANIGAVIMPFMIFFQQSAVVARGLKPGGQESAERIDTVVGSAFTQLIMIGALMTMAGSRAALGAKGTGINSIEDVALALAPTWGLTTAKVLVSVAFLGAALCASFVVVLCSAWAVNEALGLPQPMGEQRVVFSEAPAFYCTYFAIVVLGIGILSLDINIVKLNIGIETLGALLTPVLLYFLYDFSTSTIVPERGRVTGWHKTACLLCFLTVSVASVSLIIVQLFNY